MNNTFPIFFQVIEQKGDKTESLINEIKKLAIKFDIYDDVNLAGITDIGTSANENALIYEVQTYPATKNTQSINTINFLSHIFQKMFDKYPSYVDPIKGTNEQ